MVETDVEFIARIKALAEKATPGEWIDCVKAVRRDDAGPLIADFHWSLTGRPYAEAEANASFVAAARTAIPRLIGMVEERERERDEARKKYDEHFINRIMEIPDADLLALIPKDERDVAVVQGKQAVKIGILTAERNALAKQNTEANRACESIAKQRDVAIARAEAAEVEIERLSGVIERDRTKTAESIARLRTIVAGRSWLGEGRGNLAWDDDQYQEEFRGMIEEFMAALDPLKALAADWSDCPKDFQAARIDWKVRAEAAESARREAVVEAARLREALEDIKDRSSRMPSGGIINEISTQALASKDHPHD